MGLVSPVAENVLAVRLSVMSWLVIQSFPDLKDPLEALVCVTVRNLDLTCLSLRLSVRRKATRGVNLKTLGQRKEQGCM